MHICHFMPLQNKRFAKSEIHVAKRRIHVQARLKRCIFFSSLGKTLKTICSFSLFRKLVRVPLPLLLVWEQHQEIHKIAKCEKENLAQDKHQNKDLFRRHAIDWSHTLEELVMSRDTVIFLLQHLGFVIN